MTSFIGIDWALTHTGVTAWVDGEWERCTIRTRPDDGTPAGFLHRVDDIATQVIAWADPREGDVWAIESPALGAKGAAVDRMFAGWWMTVRELIDHHDTPWVFTPASVKKLATGRGNASKDEVILATAKRIPEADVTNEHESDAAWLAVAASILGGQPIITLPNTHTTGLKRIMLGKGAS